MNRLVRSCVGAVLAAALSVAVSAPLAALETPLVLIAGTNMGTINAGSGQVAIYEMREKLTTRKGIANFLHDLQRLDVELRPGYSWLRAGWPEKDGTTQPTPEELITKAFRKEPSPEQKKAGVASDQERVRKAEDEFWGKDHPFDGVVRGALGTQVLMVAVPAKRVVLFYRTDNQNLKLISVYNYSPALYVQLAWQSLPNPLDLAKTLDLPKDQQEALTTQFKAQDENGSIQAGPSEVWCCANGNFFTLLDTANRRLITFEDVGKSVVLRSVRNISVDLAIPVGLNSLPNASAEASNLVKQRADVKGLVQELGLEPFDQHTLKALVAVAQAGEGVRKQDTLQASYTTSGTSQVVLDFLAQRKLLVYNLQGSGNALELASVRDYSFDIAIDMLQNMSVARLSANQMLARADKQFGKETPLALQNLKLALRQNPALADAVRKNAQVRKLTGKDKEEAEALIAQAEKDRDAFAAQVKSAVETAAAEREKAKKGGK